MSAYWDKMTPEQRSAEVKRRMANRTKKPKRKYTKRAKGHKPNKKGASNDGSTQAHDHIETHASYIFGKVETIIEYYANSNGIPKSTLAERVADLLRR